MDIDNKKEDKLFNFDKLVNASGSFPENDIIIDVGKKQQKEGVPDEKNLGELLEFAVGQATSYFYQVVNIFNKQVAEGIDSLARYGKWVNLGKIAEHALENKVRVIENEFKDKKNMQDIIQLTKLYHEVLRSGIPDINRICDSEWLKTNYPLLVRKEENKSTILPFKKIEGGKDGKKE